MPGMRRKVTFIKLKIFRSERRNMLFQCFVFVYIMYLFTLCLSVKPNINLYIGVLRENMRQIKHRPVMSPFLCH
jgi:hypothetical protein